MKDEALKLALNWIEGNGKYADGDKIAAAIKEALSQAEQEPVAWVDASSFAMMRQDPRFDRVQWQTTLTLSKVYEGQIPLYTNPLQRKSLTKDYTAEDLQNALDRGREIGRSERKPLTFEQVEDCFPDGYSTEDNGILVSAQWLHDFARAIEAAHGIKENT